MYFDISAQFYSRDFRNFFFWGGGGLSFSGKFKIKIDVKKVTNIIYNTKLKL
jgi:hypothetical protein